MGNVERCDKTLALNEMIFYVRRDARLRERWTTDLEALCREFGVTSAEYEALRDQDLRRLNDMGVLPEETARAISRSVASSDAGDTRWGGMGGAAGAPHIGQ